MGVLAGNLGVPVLAALRFDDPHCRCGFDKYPAYEIGVVQADRSFFAKVLHPETGKPFGQLGERLHIPSILHELAELFLESIEAGNFIEDRLLGVTQASSPNKGPCIGKTNRFGLELDLLRMCRVFAEGLCDDANELGADLVAAEDSSDGGIL